MVRDRMPDGNVDVAKPDYYDILGVSRTATAELIRAAHRVQSRRYHPDTADDGKGDALLFAQTQEAYETLSNPDARRRYDTKEGFNRGEYSAGGTRRPPKSPCGVCAKPVYASQLTLYLGRRMCVQCFELRKERHLNRPRLTGVTEMGWRLKRAAIWAQSHLALIVVIILATVAVGVRLFTYSAHGHRPSRPLETSPATTSSQAKPLGTDPLLDPCRVPPLLSSESADVRASHENEK